MATFPKYQQFLGLIGWLVAAFAASAVGAIASINAGQYYAALVQPDWAPPAGVFGPVWTLLYTLMGIAAWLVWRNGGLTANGKALTVFVVQLAVNALWSWLFFAWQLTGLALLDILVLWGLILATLVLFWRVTPVAGVLLIPYLGWVTFAGFLNYSLWQLNG